MTYALHKTSTNYGLFIRYQGAKILAWMLRSWISICQLWRPATFERALFSYRAKSTMATIGQVKDLLKKEL